MWDKNIKTDKLIENFTVGKDRELDLLLARFDVLGSMAHIAMLENVDLISAQELRILQRELLLIYDTIIKGEFSIEEGIEDVHSQVELMLTRKLGETGKKIHAARSRNDQVLLDLKLYIRDRIQEVSQHLQILFNLLIEQSEKYKNILIPGYTHLQVAMPSSFGLWFGAFAESLTEDMLILLSAYRIADKNPLGSAAGYGSSFPINRAMTTSLLGFSDMHINVVNAQMSRGKTERVASFALATIAGTLSKMSADICLFASQNFGFLSLPEELTTGSSIMPHKKNPDVFELIRARCNKIQALPGTIDRIMINLVSGYFRDMQIIKEVFLPVFDEIISCLDMLSYAVGRILPGANILNDEKYKYIYSVENVNKLVLKGMPFRDAYKEVALKIQQDRFEPESKLEHTHEGSMGNLCNAKIVLNMQKLLEEFHFEKVEEAYRNLLKIKTD